MKTVIISRRIISLAILSIIGVAMLLLCRHSFVKEQTVAPGIQVNSLATSEVRFNDSAEITGEKKASDLINKTNFYVEYRIERERTRGQRVEWLREVINNVNSSSETRQKAQENLMSISNCMEKEVEMENLIKAKGYNDAAVLIDNRSVTAVVATKILNPEEVVSLTDLIARGTGIDSSNIIIIPRY